jgi:hypothetical protein
VTSIQEYFEDYEEAQELYKKTLKQKAEAVEVLYYLEKIIYICEHYFETGELLDPGNDFQDPDFSLDPTLGWDLTDE